MLSTLTKTKKQVGDKPNSKIAIGDIMKMTKRMDGIYAKKVFYTFPATNTKTLVKETLKAGERPPASGTFKYKGATYFPPPDHEVEVRFFLQPAK